MARFLLVLVAVGLLVYAFTDCVQAPDRRPAGLPKGAWLVVIVVLPFVGPVVWLLVSRTVAPGGRPGGRRPGPLAPDDDPDFLRGIDPKRRP